MSDTEKTVANILRQATLSAREHAADLEEASVQRERDDVAFLIEDVMDQFDEFENDPLAALGVEIRYGEGMFTLKKCGHSFVVEPGSDGVMLINGEQLKPEEPFYTDALYQAVFQRIARWADSIDDAPPV